MKTKLKYRFHNPNSVDDTAEYLCKLFAEANVGKVERAVKEVALSYTGGKEYIDEPDEREMEDIAKNLNIS